jgi:hypothetical protein
MSEQLTTNELLTLKRIAGIFDSVDAMGSAAQGKVQEQYEPEPCFRRLETRPNRSRQSQVIHLRP